MYYPSEAAAKSWAKSNGLLTEEHTIKEDKQFFFITCRPLELFKDTNFINNDIATGVVLKVNFLKEG
jgi:hypothetical protein